MGTKSSKSCHSTVFFVSNLGQLRNAIAVADQLNIANPIAIILWTEARIDLRDRLVEFANLNGFDYLTIGLPRSPNDPFPRQLRAINRAYVEVFDALSMSELWVANTNSHYAHLLALATARGVPVSYFEEGLGTYFALEDPPFRPINRRIKAIHLLGDVASALTATHRTLPSRVRRAGHRVLREFGNSSIGRRAVMAMAGIDADIGAQPARSFSRIAVVFPDALDARLYQAPVVKALDLTLVDISSTERLIESWPVGRQRTPLLLTQPYGIDARPWSQAISDELAARSIERVTVKFHPREGGKEREFLARALVQNGLEPIIDSDLDKFPAEQLIRSGLTDHVLGLTSSTLLYRLRPAEHEVTYESIAQDVVTRLTRWNTPKNQLRSLSRDMALYDRLIKTLGDGQKS